MPIDDKMMIGAVEALEKAKENLEAVAQANMDFEEKAEEISKSIDDVFDRQKEIEKSIAKLETAMERLESSLERINEAQTKIEELTDLIQQIDPERMEQLGIALKEKVSESIETYEESVMHPKAKKTKSNTPKKSSARKKSK